MANKFYFIIIIIILLSCEYPFLKNEPNRIDLINISGNITNSKEGPPIRVFQSLINGSGKVSSITPISKAIVEIIENESVVSLFEERDSDLGFYFPPKDFFAKPNSKYKLKVTLPNNDIYISSSEIMPNKKAKILNVSQKFEYSNTPFYDDNYFARHAIYLDFQDSLGKGDYYMLNYKLFQEQIICQVSQDNPNEIYGCKYNCWDIIENYDINIFDDSFTDGNIIRNKILDKIPYYEAESALLKINIETISKEAFSYFKIILNQTERAGTLADTPASSFQGNISGTKLNSKPATGYFYVSNLETTDYWLNREDVDTKSILPNNLYFRIKKKIVNDQALCINSYNRTNKLPSGWLATPKRSFQPN